MAPLQKDFYEEHPDVTNMSAEQVAAIRQQNNNTTADRLFLEENADRTDVASVPNPVETFAQCFAKYPDLMGATLLFAILSLQIYRIRKKIINHQLFSWHFR